MVFARACHRLRCLFRYVHAQAVVQLPCRGRRRPPQGSCVGGDTPPNHTTRPGTRSSPKRRAKVGALPPAAVPRSEGHSCPHVSTVPTPPHQTGADSVFDLTGKISTPKIEFRRHQVSMVCMLTAENSTAVLVAHLLIGYDMVCHSVPYQTRVRTINITPYIQ